MLPSRRTSQAKVQPVTMIYHLEVHAADAEWVSCATGLNQLIALEFTTVTPASF